MAHPHLELEAEATTWWRYAIDCARTLRAHRQPPAVDVWGPILAPGEHGLMPVGNLAYSRLYGGDGRYHQSNLFVFGKPEFVLGALGVNALVNHQRRAEAQRRAAVQWRDHQVAPVFVTSARLWCSVARHGWISFSLNDILEFHPDLDNWALTLSFRGAVVPLRLQGPAAPAVALWVAVGVFGDQWARDPRLTRLQ
ncbi:hypothetical protein H7K45_02080 [Mycobacterium yunnanensis]|uniref:Uncharacterized protein n=1 Tax=Mycobacterium yunnanensis TaxID=368477 RepID=A0A9X3BYR2_9MYCO|nr:hypothetical protein [Mycobacterium yunnanensis]MCV7419318.1 hypothetical protein [Mycobacterium yunnanensis]